MIQKQTLPNETRSDRVSRISKSLFWSADTVTIRLILGIASLIWGIPLIFFNTNIPKLPIFYTTGLHTNLVFLGCLFFLHGIGVLWRIYDPKPRIICALLVNILGLLLWLQATMFIVYSTRALTSGTSLELVMCCFAAWALYRTGLREEIVTP